jgi:hypothetical protein
MDDKITSKIAETLAKRFILTFEQAKDLYFAYLLSGSCDEGVETVAKMYGISKAVVKQVFESLDDLYHNPEYYTDKPEDNN